jgi:winged helix DNA-binding protein
VYRLVPVKLAWTQALAWRLRRQLLDPVGTAPVEAVVRRLVAIPAQSDFASELSVRTRREHSEADEVQRAREDGRLILTFSFRGSMQLMTPEDAGIYLSIRMAGRQWELKSWRTYYRLEPSDWPALREVVRDALADGPLSVDELIAAIAATPRFAHLGPILGGNPWSVLKALAWHGEMSFGPARNRRPTFQRLDRNPRWAGIPSLDEAGPRAVEAYLRTYGPATPRHLQYWLGEGLSAGRKRVQAWISGLSDRLAEIEIDGETNLLLRDDLEDLADVARTDSAGPSPGPLIRLLPSYDPWVLGPGTADTTIVPPARRELVTRGANVVIAGGVVSGTWTLQDDEVAIDWFAESGPPREAGVEAEVSRLASILGRPLRTGLRAA